jgi:hypothetical protein
LLKSISGTKTYIHVVINAMNDTWLNSDGISALGNAAGRRHLARVASLPCSVCGVEDQAQAHHPRGLQWCCGMGERAPDDTAILSCVFHHDEYHRYGRQTWETKHGTHHSHLQKTRKRLELPAFDDSV